jgi:hypothetical protein
MSGRRQLGEPRVGGREAAQRIRAGGDHLEPPFHVGARFGAPVVGPRLAGDHRLEAARDRLDGRQRVVDLVSDHPNQPLPCLALFVAQRAADVGEHEELVRPSLLPERGAAHFPAAAGAGERDVVDARRRPFEARAQPEFVRPPAQQLFGRRAEQSLACAVDEAKGVCGVEGEHRHVDLDHHGAQECARLDRAQPLVVKGRRELVHLEHHGGQRIVGRGPTSRAARADREVALTERREQIRQRLQRQDDAVPHGKRAAGPHSEDERGEGPLHP